MEQRQGNVAAAKQARRGLGLLALVGGTVLLLLAGCSADDSGNNGPTIGPAPTVTVKSTPSTVTAGMPVTITWATTDATSCTASGAWTGTKATSGAESVTPSSTPGTYTYTLTCTGSGQQQGSGSATVTVTADNAPPPSVTIGSSAATAPAGGNFTLIWSTINAVSCVASSAWSGDKAINGSEAIVAPTTVGSYTYTLTCLGADKQQGVASAVVTVTAAGGLTPTVSLTANPASAVTGSTTTLTWATTNADSCVASGAWSGSKATSGNETTAALTPAATYSYTLTCTNTTSGASASSTANVTISDFAVMCPTPGQKYSGLHAPNATVDSTNVIGLCVGCTVTDQANVIDNDPNFASYAIMSIPVGLLNASQNITATSTNTVFPAGSSPGFVIADPSSQLLTLTLIRGVTVATLSAGTLTGDSAGAGEPLQLDILGLLLDGKKAFVSVPATTKPYDALRLTQTAGLVGAISTIRVYDGGVCQ